MIWVMALLMLGGPVSAQLIFYPDGIVLKGADGVSAFEIQVGPGNESLVAGEDWLSDWAFQAGEYVMGAAADEFGPVGLSGDRIEIVSGGLQGAILAVYVLDVRGDEISVGVIDLRQWTFPKPVPK